MMPVQLKQQGAEPVLSIVKALESLLARAQTGEIRGLCCAFVPQGKEVECIERFEPGDAATAHKLVAGMAYAQHMLVSGLVATARAT